MRVRGNSLEVDTINTQLEGLKIKVIQIANQLSLLGKPFNVHTIRKRLEGNEASQISLMRVCAEQIKEMERLKGKTYAPATIIKYKNTVLRLKQFVKYKYKRSDIFLYELNYHFITEFEAYLKHKFDRLNVIRDIFVFCCYTGLAYAEVEALCPDNVTTGMDGEPWLSIHRKKTDKHY